MCDKTFLKIGKCSVRYEVLLYHLICLCEVKGVFPHMGNNCDFPFLPAALDQTRFKVGGYCKVCKMAVNYIDGILEKNATEAQIEEAVRKVCSFLPDSLQTEVSSCIFLPCPTFTHPPITSLH